MKPVLANYLRTLQSDLGLPDETQLEAVFDNEAPGEQLCWQQRSGGFNETTCPVGSFPDGSSPFGVLDMAGNVAEWTSTEVTGTAAPGAFSTRGGSYTFDPLDRAEPETAKIRADQSEPVGDGNANPTLGVRCAKSL